MLVKHFLIIKDVKERFSVRLIYHDKERIVENNGLTFKKCETMLATKYRLRLYQQLNSTVRNEQL